MPEWVPAVMLASLSLVAVAVVRPGTPPLPVQPLAAVFPFWWSSGEAFGAAAKAEVAIVRTGSWPAVVIVQPAGEGAMQEARDRLLAAGAWWVLDGRGLGGCSFGG